MGQRRETGKFVLLISLLLLGVNSTFMSEAAFVQYEQNIKKIINKPTQIPVADINNFLILQNRFADLQVEVGRIRIACYQYYLKPRHSFPKQKSYYQKQIKFLRFIITQLKELAKQIQLKKLTESQRQILRKIYSIIILDAQELIDELNSWILLQEPTLRLPRPFPSFFEQPEHATQKLSLKFYHSIQLLQLHAIFIFSSLLSQCILSFESRQELYKMGLQVIQKMKQIQLKLKTLKEKIHNCHGLTKKMKKHLTKYVNQVHIDLSTYINWIMNYFLPEAKAEILGRFYR